MIYDTEGSLHQAVQQHCLLSGIGLDGVELFGTKVSQARIFRSAEFRDPVTKNSLGSWDATIMLAIKDEGYVMDAWIDYRKVKISKRYTKLFRLYRPKLEKAKGLGLIRIHRNGDLNLIRSLLKKGIPVIVEVHLNTFYRSSWWDHENTHSLVVIGYERGAFVVHDPNSAYKGYKKDGGSVRVSAEHLKKSLVCPYYRNSINILSKK